MIYLDHPFKASENIDNSQRLQSKTRQGYNLRVLTLGPVLHAHLYTTSYLTNLFKIQPRKPLTYRMTLEQYLTFDRYSVGGCVDGWMGT